MKISFQLRREKVMDALLLLQQVLTGRSIKPILQFVKATVSGRALTLEGTNLEQSLRAVVPIEGVEGKGSFCLPLVRFLNILRKGASDRAQLVVEGRDIGFTIGGFRGKIMGEDPEEYPAIPVFPEKAAQVNRRIFLQSIHRVRYAIAKERSRFAFNGARLQNDGGHFVAVATDGKRMAVAQADDIGFDDAPAMGHIVPGKAIDLILAAFEEKTPVNGFAMPLQLFWDEREVGVRLEEIGIEIRTRLVDGAFPKYESVIPRDAIVTMAIARDQLLASLDRVMLFTNPDSRACKFEVDTDTRELLLKARATDVGDCCERVRVEIENTDDNGSPPPGIPKDFAFNPDFMMDTLMQMRGPNLKLAITGKDTPAKLTDPTEGWLTHVIMPVTTRNAE